MNAEKRYYPSVMGWGADDKDTTMDNQQPSASPKGGEGSTTRESSKVYSAVTGKWYSSQANKDRAESVKAHWGSMPQLEKSARVKKWLVNTHTPETVKKRNQSHRDGLARKRQLTGEYEKFLNKILATKTYPGVPIGLRSGFEAAVYRALTNMGIDFRYEGGYTQLPSGKRVVIDFWLPDHNMYIEVKSTYWLYKDYDKIPETMQYVTSRGKRYLLLLDVSKDEDAVKAISEYLSTNSEQMFMCNDAKAFDDIVYSAMRVAGDS